ncbi:MAG: hypothetical protein VX994_00045 [Bacteroidota bacterium]|nr:hypothetical protein [Bacteroidota bacterium]
MDHIHDGKNPKGFFGNLEGFVFQGSFFIDKKKHKRYITRDNRP